MMQAEHRVSCTPIGLFVRAVFEWAPHVHRVAAIVAHCPPGIRPVLFFRFTDHIVQRKGSSMTGNIRKIPLRQRTLSVYPFGRADVAREIYLQRRPR